jgi:DNA helicase-2/ATP-dependent DNA helicase PcrA
MLGVSAQAVLDGLDPEQRQVATCLLGPVCVLAGAGTGKTRAITHRIAYGVRTGTYAPANVLAVTFTTRAAGELRERLRALGAPGVQARTFHSAALRQLAHFLPKVAQRAVPRLVEHKAAFVAQAAGRLGLEVDRAAIRDLAAEIEWAKVNLWTAQHYQEGAARAGRGPVAGYDAIAMARLMRVYEEVLAEAQTMDFEDVLLATAGLLVEYPEVAEQVRRQYRHFVVDEYQDVSPVQQRLLDLWLGGREELCVVGDPSQTIYSFTGASAQHLLDFPRAHPDAAVIRLVRDYRSTPQVVSLANAVLRSHRRTRGEAPAREALELVAQRPSGPAAIFRTAPDDAAEAAETARQISRLVAGGLPASDIAVLFRTNAQSEPFEAALGAAGIAFQVRGAARFFTRAEVRRAIALLRAESRAKSAEDVIHRAHTALAAAGWSPTPPPGRGAVREQWESLDALERLVREVMEQGATTLAQVVAVILDREANEHAPGGAGVTLASLHAAKGLEWEAVFLAGLSDGLMPISLAEGPEQLAEERRLLYVGITRARERLTLSYAQSRNQGGAPRRVSRFLASLWPERDAAPARSALVVPDAADLTEAERALFERLRAWRLAQAGQEGKRAYAIMPDVTLRAIAAARPATERELAAIPGFGPVKIARYGAPILAAVAGRLSG